MVDLEHARVLLEEVGLNTAAQLLDAHLEQSVHEELSYVQFLDRLLAAEQLERRRKGQETQMKLSRLLYRKQLEDFDFDCQPSIDRRQVAELSNLAFMEQAENVIFLGPPGVGETHLSVGLVLKALEAGKVVYYTTLSYLIEDLKKAQSQGRLDRRG